MSNKITAVEPARAVVKAHREQLRDRATAALKEAEQLLAELAGGYTEEKDGTFSACHPHNGFVSTEGQITKIRKALAKAKV